jgi:mannose-6-phosphate isomerase-like protein (cupin superfamily)
MDNAQLSQGPFAQNVQQLALENSDFRRVINTTARSQLVLMSVPPGGEIGEETHPDNDQILSFVQGSGHAVLAGARQTVSPGTVVVVPAGTRHNFLADQGTALKLFTVYAPPHHRPGTVHKTKADADADTADAY